MFLEPSRRQTCTVAPTSSHQQRLLPPSQCPLAGNGAGVHAGRPCRWQPPPALEARRLRVRRSGGSRLGTWLPERRLELL